MREPPFDYLWFVVSASSLLAAVGLWLTRRGHVRGRDLVPAIVLLAILQPAAWFYVEGAGRDARERIFAALIAFAPTYAQEMAVLGHASITPDTASDNPAYLRMIEAEKRWLAANPVAADIYTFRPLPDGRIVYLVDAETDYDHNGLFEGDRESRTEIGEELETELRGPIDEAMRGVSLVDDDIEADRWGVWISAYAPILGPDGKPEALLGIDYHAEDYVAAVAAARARALVLVGVVGAVVLSLCIIIALLRHNLREREERNAKLDAAAREVQWLNSGLETTVRERTTQLETANRELEAFAYSVSHDLRTPLRSIEGFANLVVEESGDRLPPAARAHLERVQRAGRHMSTLIDDLLRLSRVTRTELVLERVDVSSLAVRIAEDLRQRYPQHDVRLRVAPGLSVNADIRLLEIALENLLDNAWKYSARREPAHVEVGCTHPGVWFVRDDGCGFDMRFVDKLFRPFQRLHSDEEFEGNGIGLATVARIVERHGGWVSASARPGAGCTISFTLSPAVSGMAAESPADLGASS